MDNLNYLDHISELQKMFTDYIKYTIPGVNETVKVYDTYVKPDGTISTKGAHYEKYDYILIDGLNYITVNHVITYDEVYNIVTTLMSHSVIKHPIVLIFFKEKSFYDPSINTSKTNIPVQVYLTSTCNIDGYNDVNTFYEWLFATCYYLPRIGEVEKHINYINYYNNNYIDPITGEYSIHPQSGAGLIDYEKIDLTLINQFDTLATSDSMFRPFIKSMSESFSTYIQKEKEDGTLLESDEYYFKTIVHNLKSYDDNILFRKLIALLTSGFNAVLISNDKFDCVVDSNGKIKYKFIDKKVGFADGLTYYFNHQTLGIPEIITKYQFYPAYDERDLRGNLLWRNNIFTIPHDQYNNIKTVINDLINCRHFHHYGHLKSGRDNNIILSRNNWPQEIISVTNSISSNIPPEILNKLNIYLTKINCKWSCQFPSIMKNPNPPNNIQCEKFDYTFPKTDLDGTEKILLTKKHNQIIPHVLSQQKAPPVQPPPVQPPVQQTSSGEKNFITNDVIGSDNRYREKYLKYKAKYIALKNKIN